MKKITRLHISLPAEVAELMKTTAAERGHTVSGVLQTAVIGYLKTHKPEQLTAALIAAATAQEKE